jgi:hypothetical protein
MLLMAKKIYISGKPNAAWSLWLTRSFRLSIRSGFPVFPAFRRSVHSYEKKLKNEKRTEQSPHNAYFVTSAYIKFGYKKRKWKSS